jgi:5-methylcytosine-specific restriction endonuclease McrA
MENLLNDKLKYLKDLSKIITVIETEISDLLYKNQKLSDVTIELQEKIQKKSDENNNLNSELTNIKLELETTKNVLPNRSTFKNEKTFTLGINNLSVRNNEAIHDALSHFEKKCPYCNEELFKTTKRKQFEVDHFFPVVKGGQDLPWNILPVCQSCNRKKRDTLPHNFLSLETFKNVSSYLNIVHNKHLDESIDSYTFKEKISELLKNEHQFIIKNINSKFISTLLYLAEQHDIINETPMFENEFKEMVDDDDAILILNYLSKEIPINWSTLNLTERRDFLSNKTSSETIINQKLQPRKFVCIAEIWCECLEKNKNDMNRYETRNLNTLMKNLSNWVAVDSTKNFSFYGKQRYYERRKQ